MKKTENKISVTIVLDESYLDRVDKFRTKRDIPTSRSRWVKEAVIDYIDQLTAQVGDRWVYDPAKAFAETQKRFKDTKKGVKHARKV
jgi:hypothetical protein